MCHSAIGYKHFVVILAALQLHAISIGCNGDQVIYFDIKASLLPLKDDTPIRDIKNAAEGLILYIVSYIGMPTAQIDTGTFEQTWHAIAVIPSDIALLHDLLLIDGLIDIVAFLAAFEKDSIRVQDRKPTAHDFVYSRHWQY